MGTGHADFTETGEGKPGRARKWDIDSTGGRP